MISPTQFTTQPNTQSQPASQTTANSVASDFDTFLLLMTTQARNQDPLEPMDSSEYASQLAQFSMVEQQVQANDLLSELLLSFSGMEMAELSNWVGMDVQTTAAFRFDGNPVALSTHSDTSADKAILVIRDGNGAVIDKINVAPSETEFAWAGTADDGSPLATGTYSAILESYDGEDLLSAQPVASYNRVVEAQIDDASVLLTLETGEVVPAATVTAIRTGA